jgi:hypothetical protein
VGNSYVEPLEPEVDNLEEPETREHDRRSRVPFRALPHDHDYLVDTALRHARQNLDNVYGVLLSKVEDCESSGPTAQIEQRGASYCTLYLIADAVDMTADQEEDWISLCESLPLSEHMARCILRLSQQRMRAAGGRLHRRETPQTRASRPNATRTRVRERG